MNSNDRDPPDQDQRNGTIIASIVFAVSAILATLSAFSPQGQRVLNAAKKEGAEFMCKLEAPAFPNPTVPMRESPPMPGCGG
jgi:hypothetical protein